MAFFDSLEDGKLTEARRQFEANLFGLPTLTQRVLSYMRSKKPAIINNVSSMNGKIYFSLSKRYIATKRKLEGWSDCLMVKLPPVGIKVIIMQPRIARTRLEDTTSPTFLKRFAIPAFTYIATKLLLQ